MKDKTNIIPFGNGKTEQTRVSVKLFASDKKMYKSSLEYICNGEIIQTGWLGNPSGEDHTVHADRGSCIKVISGYGKPTHFKTDGTFNEKVNELSDHILIKVPEAAGRSSMFVVDAHLGTAHQMIRDICLAFGEIEGAEVRFEEKIRREEEVA